MQLSKNQLNGLMVILPRMRMSSIVSMSYWSPIPFETLMNIRTAGKQRKIAALTGEGYQFASQWIDAVIKDEKNGLAQKMINKNKPKIQSMLKGRKDSEEILQSLETNFLKGENDAENKKAVKEVKEYMKDKGFNEQQAEEASKYMSLFRIKSGAYDEMFVNTMEPKVKKLESFSINGIQRDRETALEDALALLSSGTITDRIKPIDDEDRKKIEAEGFSGSLDNYIRKIDGIAGAGAFLDGIRDVLQKGVPVLTDSGFVKKKKKHEKAKGEFVDGENIDDKVDLGDVEPENYGEVETFEKQEKRPSHDKDIKDTDDASIGELKLEEAKQDAIERDENIRGAVMQHLEEIIRDHVPDKNGEPDEDRIRQTIFVYKNALSNPYYTTTELKRAEAEGDTAIPDPASSTKYFSRDQEKMKTQGINTNKEYSRLTSGYVEKRIQEDIEMIIGETKKGVKAAGVTLSHQLLRQAASKGKLHMLGMVCAIEPRKRQAGKVMVFERSRPKFAHCFNWNLHNGKIRIADVNDPDEDHLNEAYQAAFEAVQQEVAINNIQEQMGN